MADGGQRSKVAVLLLILAAASCQPTSSQRAASDTKPVEGMNAVMAAIARPAEGVEDRGADWRACIADLHADDAVRRAETDVANGEWRLLSYTFYGLGVDVQLPGVDRCEPSFPIGHNRIKQRSVCGDVVGDLFALDCGCRDAELAYRAAYNRILLKRVKGARGRNCKPIGRHD